MNNIALLRKALRMTQDEFGDVAGVGRMAVSAWENGQAEPRRKALGNLAAYTGLSPDDIIGGDFKNRDLESEIALNRLAGAGVTEPEPGKYVAPAAASFAPVDTLEIRDKLAEITGKAYEISVRGGTEALNDLINYAEFLLMQNKK